MTQQEQPLTNSGSIWRHILQTSLIAGNSLKGQSAANTQNSLIYIFKYILLL